MTSKYDLSAICKSAWQQARIIARGNNKAARAHLAEAFRQVWRKVKIEVAEREMLAARAAIVLPREAYASRSQIAYIESLLGRGRSAPANLTKVAASAMIDKLKADKGIAA